MIRSPSTRPRAVVFDFDGTLFDSLPLVLRALQHALAPYADEAPTMAVFSHLGGPPGSFLPGMVRDPQNVPDAMRRLDEFHREHSQLMRPFDGVLGMLEALHALHVPAAIWTGRDRESAERLLEINRLTEYFAAVVCGDDLPTHKPDPQGLREIFARLGVAAANAIYVGDADVDVLAGHACGVPTIFIRHARTVPETLRPMIWREVHTPAEAYQSVLAWANAAGQA